MIFMSRRTNGEARYTLRLPAYARVDMRADRAMTVPVAA